MVLYRITTTDYAKDLSGTGAFLHGGRWNSKNVRLLYTSESSALAMLESLAHITMLPQVRQYVKLTIDASLLVQQWNELHDTLWYQEVHNYDLPLRWQEDIHLAATRRRGDTFVAAGKYPALRVPSAPEPDSFNYLFNPGHPLFQHLKVLKTTPVHFDQRLVRR